MIFRNPISVRSLVLEFPKLYRYEFYFDVLQHSYDKYYLILLYTETNTFIHSRTSKTGSINGDFKNYKKSKFFTTFAS